MLCTYFPKNQLISALAVICTFTAAHPFFPVPSPCRTLHYLLALALGQLHGSALSRRCTHGYWPLQRVFTACTPGGRFAYATLIDPGLPFTGETSFGQPRIDGDHTGITAVGDMVPLRELTRGRLNPCLLHAVHIDVVSYWSTTRFAAARCSTS
jgi:hypothetical protein